MASSPVAVGHMPGYPGMQQVAAVPRQAAPMMVRAAPVMSHMGPQFMPVQPASPHAMSQSYGAPVIPNYAGAHSYNMVGRSPNPGVPVGPSVHSYVPSMPMQKSPPQYVATSPSVQARALGLPGIPAGVATSSSFQDTVAFPAIPAGVATAGSCRQEELLTIPAGIATSGSSTALYASVTVSAGAATPGYIGYPPAGVATPGYNGSYVPESPTSARVAPPPRDQFVTAPVKEDLSCGVAENDEQIGGEDDCDLEFVVWSPDDVGDWIDGMLGLGVGEPFRQQGIDGPRLVGLTDKDLQNRFAVNDQVHRAKLLGALQVFQARRARIADRAANRKTASRQRPADAPSLPQTFQLSTPPVLRPPQIGSRVQSATSSVSGDCKSAASRFSRRPCSRVGSMTSLCPTSSESPSTSRKGSFTMAARWTSSSHLPGPTDYNVSEAEGNSAKTHYVSKATIGNSPRSTTEYIAPEGAGAGSVGPHSYDAVKAGDNSSTRCTSPRTTFGKSEREGLRRHKEADDPRPGPACYSNNSSTLKVSSPRCTMGSASRNTLQYVVNPDAAARQKQSKSPKT